MMLYFLCFNHGSKEGVDEEEAFGANKCSNDVPVFWRSLVSCKMMVDGFSFSDGQQLEVGLITDL